jgi:hypothetical protein
MRGRRVWTRHEKVSAEGEQGLRALLTFIFETIAQYAPPFVPATNGIDFAL